MTAADFCRQYIPRCGHCHQDGVSSETTSATQTTTHTPQSFLIVTK